MPAESVRRQNGKPDVTVKKNAYEAGREFPLPSGRFCVAGGRKPPTRDPLRYPPKKDIDRRTRLAHRAAAGFLR